MDQDAGLALFGQQGAQLLPQPAGLSQDQPAPAWLRTAGRYGAMFPLQLVQQGALLFAAGIRAPRAAQPGPRPARLILDPVGLSVPRVGRKVHEAALRIESRPFYRRSERVAPGQV